MQMGGAFIRHAKMQGKRAVEALLEYQTGADQHLIKRLPLLFGFLHGKLHGIMEIGPRVKKRNDEGKMIGKTRKRQAVCQVFCT